MNWFAYLQGLFGRFARPQPAPAPTPKPAPALSNDATKVVALFNQQRGMTFPLSVTAALMSSAQDHAEFMARTGRLGHQAIGDGTPWQRILGAGYRYAAAAENVAAGQPSSEAVVDAWMADPPHRANILNPNYEHVGVGVTVDSQGVLYWCADFARPLT